MRQTVPERPWRRSVRRLEETLWYLARGLLALNVKNESFAPLRLAMYKNDLGETPGTMRVQAIR